MRRNQFVPIQVGIFEHFEDGRLTPTMWCLLTVILLQIDYETGFWKGSAEKLVVAWGSGISKRSVQMALQQLCEKGYLKSFHTPGRRGNYMVAVHKYPIRCGGHKGSYLDAHATTAPDNAIYVPDSRQNDSDADHKSGTKTRAAPDKDGNKVEPEPEVLPNNATVSVPIREAEDVSSSACSRNKNLEVEPEEELKKNRNSKHKASGFEIVDVATPLQPPRRSRPAGEEPGTARRTTAAPGSSRQDAELVAGIYRTFSNHPYQFNATPDHREQACRMAREEGAQVFLVALDTWLTTAPKQSFYLPAADGSQPEQKAWLLKEFMDSGAALSHMQTAKPYAHLPSARGKMLRCLGKLQEVWGEPLDLDDEEVGILEQLLEDGYTESEVAGGLGHAESLSEFFQLPEDFILDYRSDAYRDLVFDAADGAFSGHDLANDLFPALLELWKKFGSEGAAKVIKDGGPWKGRSPQDFYSFCMKAAK